jgi:ABC-type transporter Mla MlaB component
MLKISRIESNGVETLRLEGKLLGPWVAELRSLCAAVPDGQLRRVDLAGVDFVDPSGAELLLELRQQGVELAACTAFVADLLQAQSGGQPARL